MRNLSLRHIHTTYADLLHICRQTVNAEFIAPRRQHNVPLLQSLCWSSLNVPPGVAIKMFVNYGKWANLKEQIQTQSRALTLWQGKSSVSKVQRQSQRKLKTKDNIKYWLRIYGYPELNYPIESVSSGDVTRVFVLINKYHLTLLLSVISQRFAIDYFLLLAYCSLNIYLETDITIMIDADKDGQGGIFRDHVYK